MRQVIDTIAEANLMAHAEAQTYTVLTEKYVGSVNATLPRVKFETADVPLVKVDVIFDLEDAYSQYIKDTPDEFPVIVVKEQGVSLPVSKEVFCVMKTLSLNSTSRNKEYVSLMSQLFAQIFRQVIQGYTKFELVRVWESTSVEKEYVQRVVMDWILSKVPHIDEVSE